MSGFGPIIGSGIDPSPDALTFQDEGSTLGTATTVNFVGDGVSAAVGSGTVTVTIPGASSSVNVGTAILDFGSPDASDGSVDITGQAGIIAGSTVNAWINPIVSVDHSIDEHLLQPLRIIAGNIVPGTGFTIYAFVLDGTTYGKYNVSWFWV